MAGRRCADWRFPTEKQAKAEETAARCVGPDRPATSQPANPGLTAAAKAFLACGNYDT